MPSRLRVVLLVMDVSGIGGTVRNVVHIANQLAARGPCVQIVSIFRTASEPRFALRPEVEVRVIHDRYALLVGEARAPWWRRLMVRALEQIPSILVHRDDESYSRFNLLTDFKTRRMLRSVSTDVLVSTRPSLNILATRHCPGGAKLILQENLHLETHPPKLRRSILQHYGKAELLTTLTEADAETYREAFGPGLEVTAIPPSVELSDEPLERDASSTQFLAVGRLTSQKGFDLLLDAFAAMAADHPEWTLRIDGGGREEAPLSEQIRRLGLADRVFLDGTFQDVEALMSRSAALVLSSRYEGFGIVLLEAMNAGLPVIAFDCPHGPGELIRHGHNGVLVPAEDVEALADALRRLIEGREAHERLAANARKLVGEYGVESLGDRWVVAVERVGTAC